MRLLATSILLALAVPSFADGRADAYARLQHGNTAEARAAYEALRERDPVTAALGLSRVEVAEGKLDAALVHIDRALADYPSNVRAHARRAELLYERGRWDEAQAECDTALKANPEHMLARFVRAQLLRDSGKLDAADGEFRWFVRLYTLRNRLRNDIKDPEELLIVGQAGSENARWHNLSDQFQFILNEVYGDALRYDPLCWQAEYQAGLLLAEKHNRADAGKAFDKALAINPRAAEVLVAKGYLQLEGYELKGADAFATRAVGINPKLVSALQLQADLDIVAGEAQRSADRMIEAKAIHPRDPGTLGRLAAARWLLNQQDEFAALEKEATALNSKPAEFYRAIADQLENRRRYPDAERFYQKAIALWPMLPGAKTSLGLLQLRTGKEAEGQAILQQAFESDRFNVRVANSLKVMRHMAEYETIRTPHFIVRFDRKLDAALGRYAAEFAEREYDRLADRFQYKPAGPLLIEVFNSHEMFSGRTVALPDLHTIGASTGPLVAMVSPNGKGVRKVFSWGRVLRHELVHVFNLVQTEYQCPHWLTEGLAVANEGFPKPPDWLKLLHERAAKDELFDLTTIDAGFIRPRSPQDWTLAYCQGNLYVEYLQKFHGQASIAGLLVAFRDGLTTPAAIRKVCGVEVPEFEAGYKQYLKGVAERGRGRKIEKPLTLTQLQSAVEAAPNDAELLARLGEQLAKRKRYEEASKLAERALEAQPGFGYGLFVKALVLRGQGEEEEAAKLLESAASALPPDTRVLRLLGKLHADAGDTEKAAALFERGRTLEPNETTWLEELAKVVKPGSDPPRRAAVLAALAPHNADDLAMRKELSQLYLDLDQAGEAERWAREAVEIDIRDAAVRKLLLAALERQGKADALAKTRKLLDG